MYLAAKIKLVARYIGTYSSAKFEIIIYLLLRMMTKLFMAGMELTTKEVLSSRMNTKPT